MRSVKSINACEQSGLSEQLEIDRLQRKSERRSRGSGRTLTIIHEILDASALLNTTNIRAKGEVHKISRLHTGITQSMAFFYNAQAMANMECIAQVFVEGFAVVSGL